MLDTVTQQCQDLMGPLDIIHRPEQDRNAGNAPLDELPLVEVLGVKPGQDLLGLHRMALPHERTGQKLGCPQTTAALERRTRQPFTERKVGQKERVLGCCDEKVGIDGLVTVDI